MEAYNTHGGRSAAISGETNVWRAGEIGYKGHMIGSPLISVDMCSWVYVCHWVICKVLSHARFLEKSTTRG